jgi:hypothetical protein
MKVLAVFAGAGDREDALAGHSQAQIFRKTHGARRKQLQKMGIVE